ncbi:MAG: YHYH protein [Cytophagales bacterium]
MSKKNLFASLLLGSILCQAQTNPAVTSFLQNTTVYGSYYTAATGGTPIKMSVLANCQQVRYSNDFVYINTTGVPAYPTGIFTGDGNKTLAGDQAAIYKISLKPTKNLGTGTPTTSGNVGIFINGVSLFDYRDGVAWNNTTKALCGGPGNTACPGGPTAVQAWNRDAIPAEKLGFDCAKGHPAGTNYHHHQNPSSFKYDATTSISYSAICSIYDSEGLYTIDKTKHSPLIGFAYDGFPIYGAYGYANVNGTGAITRMKSSYQLKTATTRTNGPDVNSTYFNGYFKEDYEYAARTSDATYLDASNGRFCVTPEYPAGIYCYFATVDANNSSVYPYVIGPTFYGNVTGAKVTSVAEATTTYTKPIVNTTTTTSILDTKDTGLEVTIFPNPSNDFIGLQIVGLNRENLKIELYDATGKLVQKSMLNMGATNTYLDTRTLYAGAYVVKIIGNKSTITRSVVVEK